MIADVSRHQYEINWALFAPTLDLVFIKATGDLNNGVDPYFERNARAAVEHGVPMHVFHYMRATTIQQAEEQAVFFWKTAQPYNPLGWVVDVEHEALTGGNVVRVTQAFIDRLRALGAEKIGLYTGHNAFRDYGLSAVWREHGPDSTGAISPCGMRPVAIHEPSRDAGRDEEHGRSEHDMGRQAP